MVEIIAKLNYALEQQLAFFAFVCSAQLFLALRYVCSYSRHIPMLIRRQIRTLLHKLITMLRGRNIPTVLPRHIPMLICTDVLSFICSIYVCL